MSARDLPSLLDFSQEKKNNEVNSRDWCDIHFPRKDVREAIHIITGEIKERGTKTPHVFLPFRRHSSDYSLKKFLQRVFIEGEISSPQVVEKVVARTDEFTLIAALKFFWCRLPGNCVIGWRAYEKFAHLEKEQGYPHRAFLDIMPQCLSSPAHASIVYDFLDLLVALSSHSRENKLSGRKISRVSGIWAFNGPKKDTGFDVTSFQIGMLSWLPASDAMFHLLLSFLRSMLPSSSRERHNVAKSLTSLVSNTSYPPQPVTLSPKSLMEVAMVTLKSNVPSKTPMELLSRMGKALDFKDPHNFYSKEDYILLKTLFKDPENITGKLSAENRRIVDDFSLADQDLVCTEEEDGVNCVLQPGWPEPSFKSSSREKVSVEVGRTLLDDYFVWAWLCSVSSEATMAKRCSFGRCFILEAELGEGYKKWVVIEEQDISLESCLDGMRARLDPRQNDLRKLEKELEKHNEQGLPPLPNQKRIESPVLAQDRKERCPLLNKEKIKDFHALEKKRNDIPSLNQQRKKDDTSSNQRKKNNSSLNQRKKDDVSLLNKQRTGDSSPLEKRPDLKDESLGLKISKKSPKVKVSSSFKQEKLPAIPPTPPAIPDKDSVYLRNVSLPEIEPEEFKIEMSDIEGDNRFDSSAISVIEPLHYRRRSPELPVPPVPSVPSAPSATSSIEDLKRMVDAATLEATLSSVSVESESKVSVSTPCREKNATPKRKPPPEYSEKEKELPEMPIPFSEEVHSKQLTERVLKTSSKLETPATNKVSRLSSPEEKSVFSSQVSHALHPLQPEPERLRPDSVGTHYYSAVESPEKRNSNNRLQLYDEFDQLENDLRDYINQPEPVESHTNKPNHPNPQHYPQKYLSPSEMPPTRDLPPHNTRHIPNGQPIQNPPYNHPDPPNAHYGALHPPQSHYRARESPSAPNHYRGPPRQGSPSYAPRFEPSPYSGSHPGMNPGSHPAINPGVHPGSFPGHPAYPGHSPHSPHPAPPGHAMAHPSYYKSTSPNHGYGPSQKVSSAGLPNHHQPPQQYSVPSSAVPQTTPNFRNKRGARKDLRNAITHGNFGI